MPQTVLIVDDNEDNRIIFATTLGARGYEVVLAKNGAEAVDLAERIRPALVLMDLHMPVMNGIEATIELKSRAQLAHIPVLAVSAYEAHEAELRAAGFCAFLPKPVAPAFLAHAVRVCIDTAAQGSPWTRVGPLDASR
ncbi:MAG TPA: response regulator [Longimicrobiales bacterium]